MPRLACPQNTQDGLKVNPNFTLSNVIVFFFFDIAIQSLKSIKGPKRS